MAPHHRPYNTPYTGENLNRIAFPIGGIGAGMFCLEGTGAISHLSVRNRPEIYNEPALFAALSVKGLTNGAKVLEGPVPTWKLFGPPRHRQRRIRRHLWFTPIHKRRLHV